MPDKEIDWFSRGLSIAALGVSIVTGGFTIYHQIATRDFNERVNQLDTDFKKLQEMPRLAFDDNIDNDVKEEFYIRISNKGKGMANIHSVNYFFNGRLIDLELGRIIKYIPEYIIDNPSIKITEPEKIKIPDVEKGYSFKPGSTRQLLKVVVSDLEKKPFGLITQLQEISITVCYSSDIKDASGLKLGYQETHNLKEILLKESGLEEQGNSHSSFCKSKHKKLDSIRFPDDGL